MGDGRRELMAEDIAVAIGLFDRAMMIALGGLAVWALVGVVV
jgi:adenosylcobinamide-phosphate synthase